MPLFTGQAEINIDAKSRVAVPAKYRALLEKAELPPTWISVPWPEGAIRLFPQATFESLASQQAESLIPSETQAEIEATVYPLAETLEADSAGRIRLPQEHLGIASMTSSELIVIGAKNRLEIRDRAAWKASFADRLRRLTKHAETPST